MIRNKK